MKTRLRLLFASLAGLAAIVITAWINTPPAPNITPVPLTASSVTSADTHTEHKSKIIPPHIVLHGTFVNDRTQLALISTDNHEQRWLTLKQHLNSNFYLDEIYKDRVLVRDTGN